MEISVPIVGSSDCTGGDRNPCGPSGKIYPLVVLHNLMRLFLLLVSLASELTLISTGVYDHCYLVGEQAKDLCPNSGLNLSKPPKRVCPAGLDGHSP